MNIEGSIALVTGANRGIGRHFVRQLLDRGAAKVYATARDPERIDIPGVTPLALDVTDADAIAAAAAIATDITLLINNAGVSTGADFVTGDLAAIRRELDTNFYGPLLAIRAFAPALAANGGGAILNVNSRLSWLSFVGANAYGASKAAAWSLTNGVRLELAAQGTQVTGLLLELDRHGDDGRLGHPQERSGRCRDAGARRPRGRRHRGPRRPGDDRGEGGARVLSRVRAR